MQTERWNTVCHVDFFEILLELIRNQPLEKHQVAWVMKSRLSERNDPILPTY